MLSLERMEKWERTPRRKRGMILIMLFAFNLMIFHLCKKIQHEPYLSAFYNFEGFKDLYLMALHF